MARKPTTPGGKIRDAYLRGLITKEEMNRCIGVCDKVLYLVIDGSWAFETINLNARMREKKKAEV